MRLCAVALIAESEAMGLAVGEGTDVHVFSQDGSTLAAMATGLRGPRIKGLAILPSAAGPLVVVATSAGEVAGFALHPETWTLSRLFSHECGLRVTCLAACARA